MTLSQQTIDLELFQKHLPKITEIYYAAFSADMRRRLTKENTLDFVDDGEVTGLSIEEFFNYSFFTFFGIYSHEEFVGFGTIFKLQEKIIFADYFAFDFTNKKMIGQGQRIKKLWLAKCKQDDTDVFIDVESPSKNSLSGDFDETARKENNRKCHQRILMHQRSGYYFFDEVYLTLPNGIQTLLAVNPKPSRQIIEVNGKKIPHFSPDELAAIVKKIEATYLIPSQA